MDLTWWAVFSSVKTGVKHSRSHCMQHMTILQQVAQRFGICMDALLCSNEQHKGFAENCTCMELCDTHMLFIGNCIHIYKQHMYTMML